MGERVGTVASLWRYPVKSMLGEELTEAEVDENGLVGDRAYALLDGRTGRVLSAKNPKRWPRLLQLRASYLATPTSASPPPPVEILLPGGGSVRSDAPDAATRLSDFLGGEVSLVTSTAAPPAVEVYSPPLEGLVVEEGIDEFHVPPGPFHDSTPIHLVTTATLTRLRDLYPAGRFDARRFRPNLLVETAGPAGFLEQAWIGRTLSIGGCEIRITKPCSRCVMTTLPQGELPEDRGILRTVVAYASGDVGVKGPVARPARIRVGDSVSLA